MAPMYAFRTEFDTMIVDICYFYCLVSRFVVDLVRQRRMLVLPSLNHSMLASSMCFSSSSTSSHIPAHARYATQRTRCAKLRAAPSRARRSIRRSRCSHSAAARRSTSHSRMLRSLSAVRISFRYYFGTQLVRRGDLGRSIAQCRVCCATTLHARLSPSTPSYAFCLMIMIISLLGVIRICSANACLSTLATFLVASVEQDWQRVSHRRTHTRFVDLRFPFPFSNFDD